MADAPDFTITAVRAAGDLNAIIDLFRAYAASLPIDLAYQGFEGEMDAMPGKYAPPDGELLLGRSGSGHALGCVAIRPLKPAICEMKRLYVHPEARGTGLGRLLVQAAIAAAERFGYFEMRLDTLASMERAQALYAKLGFETAEAYYDTPIAETVFMKRRLQPK